MQMHAVLALLGDMPEAELVSWVERGWVQPDSTEAGWEFHEIDVARVRLLHDLRRDMDVGEDALPLVLSLLDQVYELRGTLRALLGELQSRSPELFTSVVASVVRDPTRL